MSEKWKRREWKFAKAMAAFMALYLVIYFLSGLIFPTQAPESDSKPVINDKPLLTEEQKKEALETDSVAFKVGEEYIVILEGARAGLEDYL